MLKSEQHFESKMKDYITQQYRSMLHVGNMLAVNDQTSCDVILN